MGTVDLQAIWAGIAEMPLRFWGFHGNAEVRQTASGTVAVTGEAHFVLNSIVIKPGSSDPSFLREAVAMVRRRHVPGVVLLRPATQAELSDVGHELGLADPAAGPVLARDAAPLDDGGDRWEVRRVSDSAMLTAFIDRAAAIFGLPRDALGRCWTEAMLHDPAITHFMSYRRNEPVGIGTTLRTGSSVGIWNMGTPPEMQRHGAGRSLLLHAMEHHIQAGCRLFYLNSSPAGLHLYEQAGFQVVDECAGWTIPAEELPSVQS